MKEAFQRGMRKAAAFVFRYQDFSCIAVHSENLKHAMPNPWSVALRVDFGGAIKLLNAAKP
ncbi:hypothetical protein GWC77_27095 [Paraburkholderia sp. NMBU_R16]|uniref:hypothetical protein n=1 Tax=Paraburkholderia sp. NMBU_R16 TaxID=2698676 RepID=UPI001563E88F|nr:hypothetical protein [Paraburkholderia sp. NMBU_R16]NRO99538.1 hypothetical protein [Paraburkholderia sp. NMBU_R16]